MGYNDAMLWGMIGHQWAVEILRQHISRGQVRHAYLFTGPAGVGKRTLALRFAQALNCESPDHSGDACGSCRACRLLAGQSHPDLHLVEVEADKTKVWVDQVRELQRQLALAPFESRWRIALLLGFERATEKAQNALLKTLEEPASHVVILMTAGSAESLLPTIVSRCEQIRLRALSTAEIESAMLAAGKDPEAAQLLAAVAAGRPGWAARLSEDEGGLQRRAERLDQLKDLVRMSRAERFAHADALAKDPEEMVGTLDVWLSFWRDAVLTSFGAGAVPGNPDRVVEVEALVSRLGPQAVVGAMRAMQRSVEALARNANPKLVLENLMLDLPRSEEE